MGYKPNIYPPFISRFLPIYKPFTNFLRHPSCIISPGFFRSYKGTRTNRLHFPYQRLLKGEHDQRNTKPNKYLTNRLPSLKLTAKAPENGWLEYYFPFGKLYFQGAFAVSFRDGILNHFRYLIWNYPYLK